MWPERFASPLHLPFNRSALDSRFLLQPPDVDPGRAECLLVLQRGALILDAASDDLPAADAPLPAGVAPDIHVGLWDGRPCRLRVISAKIELGNGFSRHGINAVEPTLGLDLLSLGGLGQQLAHWLKTSRCCSQCGTATVFVPGSWGRRCPACDAERYPAVAPCAIVLVRRGNRVLLTRKSNWPAGRYSLVAGFVDPGECLEETVVREVREETGVEVGNIRYIGSQSWPFPSQLMVGFVAEALTEDITVETTELEDARWFGVDDLPDLPPKRSIARYILDHCLDE
ncbi:MAG: NAD(+) diphosphatase [Geothermobacteraceae bacterium]